MIGLQLPGGIIVLNTDNMKLLTLREQQMLQLTILKEIDKVCRDNNIQYYLMYGTLIGAVRHGGFIPWDDDIDIVMMREDYDKFVKACENGALSDSYVIQNRDTDPEFEFLISRVGMKGTYSDDHSRRTLKTMNYTYVDVFPLDNVPDSSDEQKRHKRRLAFLQQALHYRMNYHYDHNTRIKLVLKTIWALPFKVIPLSKYMSDMEKEIKRYNGSNTKKCAMFCGRYGYERESYLKEDFAPAEELVFEDSKFYVPKNYKHILEHVYGDYMKLPPESERIIRHRVYLRNC